MEEKREARDDSPGFKNALPREMIPNDNIVKPKEREKLSKQSPKNNATAPKRAIFFSAILPDIRRITPPWTKMMIDPKYTKVYPICLGLNSKTSYRKKLIQNSNQEKDKEKIK